MKKEMLRNLLSYSITILEEQQKEKESMNQYYTYLNELRNSGTTNMFGASSYLQEEFDLSRYEAKDILMSWMKSFPAEASKTEERA